MGKKKSVVYLILVTVLLAALCVWCTLSFNTGIYEYRSVINVIQKDETLGGSYSLTYYPDGVISAEDYEDDLAMYTAQEEQDKYTAKYQAHGTGAIYLLKEDTIDKDGNVSQSFQKAFQEDVQVLKERYEASGLEGVKLDVVNDYTVRVTLPQTVADSSYYTFFAYTGELTLSYGEGNVIMREENDKPLTDYIKKISSRTEDKTSYVVIEFTDEGRELIKTTTADATASTDSQTEQSSSKALNFSVGDNTVINLTVSSQIDQQALYISGSYTEHSAKAVAVLLQNALTSDYNASLAMTAGSVQSVESVNGENTMLYVYIALGAFLLLTTVFFIVRYHGLGAVHLYGYITYAGAMAISLAFIPFLHLGVGTLAAIMATSVLVCVSNLVAFEYARKEYQLGKTMSSSVKTGYKKCFWHLFDLHIVLALASVLTFAIALTQLQTFAFVFLLGVLYSGVCTLGLTRFYWAIMMGAAKRKDKFCNFKREEVEDDD